MRNQELCVQNKKKKDIRQLMVKLEWNEGERICIRQKQPPEVFYVLKKFAIIIGKHLCWSLFLMTLQVLRFANLSKRDSNTGAFLWNLQIF